MVRTLIPSAEIALKRLHRPLAYLWSVCVSLGPSVNRSILICSQVVEELLHVLVPRLHLPKVAPVVIHDIGVSPTPVLVILNDLVIAELVEAVPSRCKVGGVYLMVSWCEKSAYKLSVEKGVLNYLLVDTY